MLRFSVLALVVLTAALQDPPKQPDTRLTLKNGSEVTGVLIDRTETALKIDLGDGHVVNYPNDEIERVDAIPADKPETIPPELAPATPLPDQPTSAATPAVAPTVAETLPASLVPPAPAENRCAVFIAEGNVSAKFIVFKRKIAVRKLPILPGIPSNATLLENLAEELKAVGLDGAAGVRISRPRRFSLDLFAKAEGTAFLWTDAGRAALPTLLADHRGRCY